MCVCPRITASHLTFTSPPSNARSSNDYLAWLGLASKSVQHSHPQRACCIVHVCAMQWSEREDVTDPRHSTEHVSPTLCSSLTRRLATLFVPRQTTSVTTCLSPTKWPPTDSQRGEGKKKTRHNSWSLFASPCGKKKGLSLSISRRMPRCARYR
jgi:hypothetical protein